jgi:hypothetical protein
MTPLDKKKFSAVLDSLRPRGKTPLALSVEEAVKDIGKTDPSKPVTLLLLTDGGEDTTHPRRDPLKSAELLAKATKSGGARFHIVGFDINQPEWSEQLLGMAKAAGGTYWPSARAADLSRGLRAAVLGVPEQYILFDATGREIARGAFGEPLKLAEGKYRFTTPWAGRTFEHDLWINAGGTTTVTFDATQLETSN